MGCTVSGRFLGCVIQHWFVCSGTGDFMKTNDRVVYAALLKEIIICNSAGLPVKKNNSCAMCCNELVNVFAWCLAESAVPTPSL